MKKYLRMIRAKQYIKNGLIFAAAFFAGILFEKNIFIKLGIGFLAYSFVCSAIYILNDIKDYEKDRMHPVKCQRPIASGSISMKKAKFFMIILFILGYLLLSYIQKSWMSGAHFYVLLYFLLNVGYSLGLKNIPIADIMILASGFVLRVLYGAALCEIKVSDWLYLTVLMLALYMGTGKRKNEKLKDEGSESRKVLRFYSISYMEKVMHMCMVLLITFYSLWSTSIADRSANSFLMVWTVPLIFVMVIRYELVLENDNFGDPTEIVLSDRPLQIMTLLYGFIGIFILYAG